ncbi:Trk system potassium transporter TrkA [Halorientalis marina]|uniref:Trk system potassium transporter TrkA n=1 Tax=Halorientalis marina TaxID=2931976 RepID=UPI001FF3C3DE|nr:Trk system potassium transporter TrkA [Halorientalis marina]
MRVIVVGAGQVGSSIAESFADTHDVVVVDIDGSRVESLNYSVDVLAIQGDGRDLDTLAEAGVQDADMVIASTDIDDANIVTCGTASAVSDAFTIARVKRPQYLRAWQRSHTPFGVDFMVCTDLLAAKTIVGIIGLPTAQDVDMFADGLVQMTEFEIPAESPVANQTVREADRFESLTFVAIMRDESVVIPRGDTTIEPGDDVVVIGSPESTREFSAAIAPEKDGPDDIVVVGGGEIGFQTATLLEERGFTPRLVERDEERARWLAENLPKTTVMHSDATDQEFLERENVDRTDVFIAALENDQQNLLATLLAKRIGAERTIAVVNTGDFTDIFEAVGVDVAVSPREATAEEIIRFTRSRRTENVAIIEGDRAEVLEIEIGPDSLLAGRTIREAADDLPDRVVIGAIARDGEHITPRGDTKVRVGDHVVVFAAGGVVGEVTKSI